MKLLSSTILVFLPLIAGVIIASPFFPNNEVKIRRTAKTFLVLEFLYSLFFLVFFNPDQTGYQFNESLNHFNGLTWVKALGCNISFGLDGISLILVILTTFIVLMAGVASKSNINKQHKLYYTLLLILETAVLGVFTAKDLLLFVIFWEIELIPMYLLILIWGTGRKDYSAMKFILFTFGGSIFMIASVIALGLLHYLHTGVLTFDMQTLTAFKDYSHSIIIQILIFLGLFIGFAVKLPIVPIHTWLPDAHVDAPTPISMILAGILLKMGGYGLIRLNLQILPDIFKLFAPIMIILGIINIIYAAFIAFAQKDLKKLIAYSSISHMGIVLLGLGALNVSGITGAVFQMVAHGIISAGLFMMVGVIYLRSHTREISKLSGLTDIMPRISYFSMIIIFASLGLPLLIGFAAEVLVFYGAFISTSFNLIQILTVVGIFGIILTAGYLLWTYQRVFCGNILPDLKKLHDVTPHEVFVFMSIIFVIIIFGIYPTGLTSIFEPAINNLLKVI
ncbi:MAG: NuoM family protein [Candidatus Gastranaerophilaceae bacterium]|jgi:NADH-quinone oxidoreductase subunit M